MSDLDTQWQVPDATSILHARRDEYRRRAGVLSNDADLAEMQALADRAQAAALLAAADEMDSILKQLHP